MTNQEVTTTPVNIAIQIDLSVEDSRLIVSNPARALLPVCPVALIRALLAFFFALFFRQTCSLYALWCLDACLLGLLGVAALGILQSVLLRMQVRGLLALLLLLLLLPVPDRILTLLHALLLRLDHVSPLILTGVLLVVDLLLNRPTGGHGGDPGAKDDGVAVLVQPFHSTLIGALLRVELLLQAAGIRHREIEGGAHTSEGTS
ncbi:hypothetical protein KC356_g324 [Hortaea werneckii]|nr:hypothetical protein KC356_g324 [Hortaea werneckii]